MDINLGVQESVKREKADLLEYLMRRFGDRVLRLAYYYVRDRYLAEDIAQEVFCRVYRNLDRFKEESSYYTWIYRITVNLCRDYLSSAWFKRWIPWENIKNFIRSSDTENRLFRKLEEGTLFQKVMDLPTKYRMVIVLYYFEEMSTREIAKALNVRESTVRTRLCRAREKLKGLLSREEYV